MYRTGFDPVSECWRFFSSFMCSGRRFYTRKEQIEELERTKKRLQAEIAGIDELIEDLKGRERRQPAS